MVSIKEKGLLLSIIKHCEKINQKVKGLTEIEFLNNDDIHEIICFNILQIGELAKKFSPEFIKRFNSQPWKEIKGMRDRVVHGYDTLNLDSIWLTATQDINSLLKFCKETLNA